MRTLLVDNYDSFTYNLFHLLAVTYRVEPVVIQNDDWTTWRRLNLGDFDAIVVSPGPGRPQRAGDVGLSRAVFAADLPVLGVCLGHQELCHACGAAVEVAPEPVHGRISAVSHNGSGLFAGLPSPFPAVRYHSLEATRLPPDLMVTATTPRPGGGDMVMAVEHRRSPWWGVQFHPESVLTQYGVELIENFRQLAAPRRRGLTFPRVTAAMTRQRPAWSPRLAERPSSWCPDVGDVGRWSVQWRRISGSPDCLALFADLFGDDRCAFWLDSSAVAAGVSRYSILGRRGPRGEFVTAQAGTQQVRVEAADGSAQQAETDLFGYLKSELARRAVHLPDVPFDFVLGYVGYFGYEMKADCGGNRRHFSDTDDAALLFCDQAIVIDHERDEAWILALAKGDGQDDLASWWGAAEEAIGRASRQAAHGQGGQQAVRSQGALAGPGRAAEPTAVGLPVQYRHDTEQYKALVRSCLDEIRAGESYEICLTNMLSIPVDADPLRTYEQLRQHNPVPYGAFLALPGVCVMSASPECFLQVSVTGRVRTKPIKGTRARGATAEEDLAARLDLGLAEKDRSENLMIVDLLRNDLGRVAEVGSVHVPALFEVETYPSAHQLVSTIEAQLRPGLTAVDCLRAAFPGGSMTGAPKRRAMEIIDRLEGGSRGIYSGVLGYLSLNGAAQLSIVIRTLVARDGIVTLGAGGAVVALSDDSGEADEMILKTVGPLQALAASVDTCDDRDVRRDLTSDGR